MYKALYLSVLMYGAPAWQPWLAATRLEQLGRCQNRALRVITGQLQTTPVETLRLGYSPTGEQMQNGRTADEIPRDPITP